MAHDPKTVLKEILVKRLEALGYLSLRKFHADRREVRVSYELLRQVVREGRVPRAETLIRILRAMRFSPAQAQKTMELCGLPFPPPSLPADAPLTDAGESPAAAGPPPDTFGLSEDGRKLRADPASAPVGGDLPSPGPPLEDPGEIAAALSRALPKLPYRGHEDFWETLGALARLAERKLREQGRRGADQPLLFEKEPEALYQFLVRKGKIPPYMSKGEEIALAAGEGVDYRDRYRGALLGGAIGELLGRTSQGLSARDVEALFGKIEGFLPGRAGPGRGVIPPPPPPAAFLLARTLLPDGKLDPEKTAAVYAAACPRPWEPGSEFARNLSERGYPWFEAGVAAAESAPAARVAAVALLRAEDFRRMKLEAGIDAAITHPAGGAIAGAVVQAAAVARLLHAPAGSLDVIGFTRSLAPAIAGIEPDRSARGRSGRPQATLWRKLGTELTALLLRRADVGEIRESLGNGPAVQEGLPFAWGCFLRYPDDFAAAVLSAVNMGGDAEATAAIAGTLAGAYRGASGIPARLLDAVPGREEVAAAADALLVLARRGP